MTKRFRVKITPPAEAAFMREARFIEHESGYPDRAKQWLFGLYERAESLELFPHRCPPADEQAYRTITVRKLNYHNHLILFVVDEVEQVVYIINCRHGASRPRPDDLPPDPTQP